MRGLLLPFSTHKQGDMGRKEKVLGPEKGVKKGEKIFNWLRRGGTRPGWTT